jgi:hypothetical protein
MKKHRENIFQQNNGKIGHMNAIVPHGRERETQKRDLSIRYWLGGTCKRYNSTMTGEKNRKGFIEEGRGE